jgi:hypothetical protein
MKFVEKDIQKAMDALYKEEPVGVLDTPDPVAEAPVAKKTAAKKTAKKAVKKSANRK